MTAISISRFFRSEDGAVTVDWVVLTAAIVGLSVAVFTVITRDSVQVGGQVISDKLSEAANTTFDLTGGEE